MKRKNRAFKPYGLRAHFAISLVSSVLVCVLLFLVLYSVSDCFLTNYFEQSDFLNIHIQKQGENLQKYIKEKNISSKNLQQLEQWEYRQPLILLEVYSKERRIYSSFHDVSENSFQEERDNVNENHIVLIQLADMEAQAVLYSDFTYQYYIIGLALSAVFALLLFIFLFLRNSRKLIRYICRLNEEVQILEGGNLEYQVSVEGNDEITDLARSMNRMRESFQQQMESEQEVHRENRRLITEMSHDLRTPLTGILLYLEILRSHRYTSEEEIWDYLNKIDEKAHHMKQISDHLFSYSLTDVSEDKTMYRHMQDAFGRTIESFRDDLAAQGFSVVSDIEWCSGFVNVNDEYIRRIFENAASNIIKYGDPLEKVLISSAETKEYCGFSVINKCYCSGQKTESSGVGIESIRTMMRQMKGICTVEQTENSFELTLLFPRKEIKTVC